jgi:hypothetical protein
MSLDLKKSLELQRRVLGERPEVRNCRFDDNIKDDKLVSRSAAGENVVYNKKTLTAEQMLELQR